MAKAKISKASRTSKRARIPTREKPDAEDIGEVLAKREWFIRTRRVSHDESLAQLRDAALRQADRLGKFDVLSRITDSVRPKGVGELTFLQRAKGVSRPVIKARIALQGVFGVAGPAVKVSIPNGAVDALLTIALDKGDQQRCARSTVRLFRYDPEAKSWAMLPRSGASEDGTYAWGIPHRDGIYVPIGLPLNTKLLVILANLYSIRPILHKLSTEKRLDAFLENFTKEREIDQLLDEWRGDPDLSFTVELVRPQIIMGGGPDLPPLPPMPPGGFPEFDILDDLCPPWKFKRLPWHIIPEIPDFRLPFWPVFPIDWVNVGPDNFNGRIKSLAIDPSNGNRLLAGAANGGVWITTNGGGLWRATMFTELSMAIGGLAFAPSNPSIAYAATGEFTPGWGPSYPGVGVFKSTDRGETWSHLVSSQGVVGNLCSRVLVDSTDPNRVYVASNWGFYRSTDGGATWAQVLAGQFSDAVIDPTRPNILFAAAWNDGIHKSIDGGTTWSRAGWGRAFPWKGHLFWFGRLPTGAEADWIKLAIGRSGAGGTDFIIAKMGLDSGTIYTSSDGGRSFFALAGTHQPASYNEWTSMVEIHPQNHDILYAGGVGLERSTDGDSFAGVGGTHSDHHQMAFTASNPDRCFIATDGGVYRSTDAGASWGLQSHRLTATQLYSLGVSQNGSFVLGAGTQDQGILKTTGGRLWTDTGAGNEGGFFVVDPNNSSNLYCCPWSANLVRSTDGGSTWQSIRTGMTDTVGGVVTSAANVLHIAVKGGDSNTLVALGIIEVAATTLAPAYRRCAIFRSTNQGANWTAVFTLADAGTRVVFTRSNANRCYVGTADGRVFRSENSGIAGSWTQVSQPGTFISALGVSAIDAGLLYIGFAGYGGVRLMRSTDGGVTWVNATGTGPDQLPGLPVNSLVVDQFDPDTVYVANDIGVFRTTDAGATWENFSDGFMDQDVPRVLVTELALRYSTNTLYSSTMGRGAFRRQL